MKKTYNKGKNYWIFLATYIQTEKTESYDNILYRQFFRKATVCTGKIYERIFSAYRIKRGDRKNLLVLLLLLSKIRLHGPFVENFLEMETVVTALVFAAYMYD